MAVCCSVRLTDERECHFNHAKTHTHTHTAVTVQLITALPQQNFFLLLPETTTSRVDERALAESAMITVPRQMTVGQMKTNLVIPRLRGPSKRARRCVYQNNSQVRPLHWNSSVLVGSVEVPR